MSDVATAADTLTPNGNGDVNGNEAPLQGQQNQPEVASSEPQQLASPQEPSPGPVNQVALKPEPQQPMQMHQQPQSPPPMQQRQQHQRHDICRDFMKNICNRGSRCKFFHPADHNPDSSDEIHFCIDFQNRGCTRENCRFVHAHRDDAERYKQNGDISLALARAIAAITKKDTINGIPFCKEFQTGNCSRVRCRYWHINVEAERERRRRMNGRHYPDPPVPPPQQPQQYGGFGSPGGGVGAIRRPASGPMDFDFEMKRGRYDDMPPPPSARYVQDLERRVSEQTKEIEGLKRELERERERYEQLYALFRQSSAANVQTHPAADMYGSAQQQTQMTPGMGVPSMTNAMHPPRGAPVPQDIAVRWTPQGGAQSWQ
uniref:Zinc finger CCCH domain-containing protein 10 n=1 Tax=Steinernema glaseri TaxID=37863 RepID=A0A1I8A2N7_9BILA